MICLRVGGDVKTLQCWRNDERGPRYTKIGRSVTYLDAALSIGTCIKLAQSLSPIADPVGKTYQQVSGDTAIRVWLDYLKYRPIEINSK